jgi:hypothetical protein
MARNNDYKVDLLADLRNDLGLENLYRTLSKHGNPTLSTLSGVLEAIGLRIVVVTKEGTVIVSWPEAKALGDMLVSLVESFEKTNGEIKPLQLAPAPTPAVPTATMGKAIIAGKPIKE